MADNYLERKFEEHNNTPIRLKYHQQKKIITRKVLLYSLREDERIAIEHSLKMLGHIVASQSSIPNDDVDYEIIITSSNKAIDSALWLSSRENLNANKIYRFVVIGNKVDLSEIIGILSTIKNCTANAVQYNELTDMNNLARACRIFISDENTFINGNILKI